jgi:hypothetical protein
VDNLNHHVVAQGRVSDAQDAFNVQLSRVNFDGAGGQVPEIKIPPLAMRGVGLGESYHDGESLLNG